MSHTSRALGPGGDPKVRVWMRQLQARRGLSFLEGRVGKKMADLGSVALRLSPSIDQ